jgi:transcriptional regulator with XRE-family HTH domain
MPETRSPEHAAYGRALREIRAIRGISQERLARTAGLDPTYVSGIERGVRNPSLTNLLKLAKTLDVTLEDLAARAETLIEGSPRHRRGHLERHPISSALERSAIALKGLSFDDTPITPRDAEDILHDATRLVSELIETLQHFQEQTPLKTNLVKDLERVYRRLEKEWQALIPSLPPLEM